MKQMGKNLMNEINTTLETVLMCLKITGEKNRIKNVCLREIKSSNMNYCRWNSKEKIYKTFSLCEMRLLKE